MLLANIGYQENGASSFARGQRNGKDANFTEHGGILRKIGQLWAARTTTNGFAESKTALEARL